MDLQYKIYYQYLKKRVAEEKLGKFLKFKGFLSDKELKSKMMFIKTEIDLTNNIIGFTTYHKFNNYEKVIYKSNGQNSIGGLSDNSVYYANPIDAFKIKLYSTYENAVAGLNTVNISSFGSGVHKFITFDPKNIITSINIIDGGSGYENKKVLFLPQDVNVYSDTITIRNHGYKGKEIVTYTSNESLISGLSSSNNYYIKVIDSDNIKLSSAVLVEPISVLSDKIRKNYIDLLE